MICPNCGTENQSDARFCANCGIGLGRRCPNCGAEVPEDARFCQACGTALAEPDGPSAEERKLVTILFADVTGSTTLGERLDPERLREVMQAFFTAMRAEIEAEGGTVEKYIGDAVMAAFGVPSAHEDDPSRALRAALRMRAALEALNGRLQETHGVALAMRVGVNTGEVLAVTDPKPGEAMATGDTVNAAARLEAAAAPGQVVVAERTARAARGFRFRELGALALKGRARPVSAFELLGEGMGASRGIPGLRAPLVGRDQEMELLRTLYRRVAAESRPQLVTVYGDAGVGKSRLTREFIDWAEGQDPPPTVVRGRCLPSGEGVTYWPLAEILKGLAGVLDSDAPDHAVEKIRKIGSDLLSGGLVPDPARATAALSFTIDLEDPDHRLADLAPRQVRLEVHAAWRALFSGLAASGPLVVVIEDIHWADPALLDLLEELGDRVVGPALFLCPARPELTQRRPGWGGGVRNATGIFLDPLSRADADRLVGFLLTVANLPDALRQRILERAEGNPFFLEEILRQLVDEGRIVRDGDRWRAAEAIEDVLIPDTVQGVLAARIDLLEPDEKRALQSAAVVGRIFWPAPVRRLLNGEGDMVEDILGRLEDRELVAARLGSSMAGESEYAFKHVLTRDVAYESLPRRDRARAHAEVATWIEETAGERSREFAELLAHHYEEAYRAAVDSGSADTARLRERAHAYLVQGSRDATSKLAVEKGERLGERGLALAEGAAERAEALEALGESYQYNYRGDLAWRVRREAVEIRLAGTPDDRRAIARACARAVETPLRWPGSMTTSVDPEVVTRFIELGLEHAGPGDDVERVQLLTAKAFLPFGYPTRIRGDEELQAALEAGEQAVALAERLGRPDLVSLALDSVGSTFIVRGLYGPGERIDRRRLELARTVLEDPWELGDIFAVAAWGAYARGNYGEAVALAEEGLGRSTMDAPGVALHCLSWLGIAHWRLGDWDGVLGDLERAGALLGDRAAEPPGFSFTLLGAAAFVQEARGNVGAADRLLLTMRSAADKRAGQPFPYHDVFLAEVLGRRGDFEQAVSRLDDPYYHRLLGPLHELLQVRSRIVAEAGWWDQASDLVARMRSFAEEAGLVALPLFADRLEGQAALAAGVASQAVELLTRSRDGLARLGARWEAARVDLSLAEALAATGRGEEARVLGSAAHGVFDGLGSIQELARARELLARLG